MLSLLPQITDSVTNVPCFLLLRIFVIILSDTINILYFSLDCNHQCLDKHHSYCLSIIWTFWDFWYFYTYRFNSCFSSCGSFEWKYFLLISGWWCVKTFVKHLVFFNPKQGMKNALYGWSGMLVITLKFIMFYLSQLIIYIVVIFCFHWICYFHWILSVINHKKKKRLFYNSLLVFFSNFKTGQRNRVVLISNSDYYESLESLSSDKSRFRSIDKDPTLIPLSSLQR